MTTLQEIVQFMVDVQEFPKQPNPNSHKFKTPQPAQLCA